MMTPLYNSMCSSTFDNNLILISLTHFSSFTSLLRNMDTCSAALAKMGKLETKIPWDVTDCRRVNRNAIDGVQSRHLVLVQAVKESHDQFPVTKLLGPKPMPSSGIKWSRELKCVHSSKQLPVGFHHRLGRDYVPRLYTYLVDIP